MIEILQSNNNNKKAQSGKVLPHKNEDISFPLQHQGKIAGYGCVSSPEIPELECGDRNRLAKSVASKFGECSSLKNIKNKKAV